MNRQEEQEAVGQEPAGVDGAEAASAEEPSDVEGLTKRLEEEKEKAAGYLSSWQRAAADLQNYKRRVEQERSEAGRLASASLVINLLPLLDDLDRALKNVDVKLAGLTWIDGVWLIYRKFQAVLENFGVKEIPAEGQPFDPNVHEAISEAPGETGKVVSVVQKGYSMGERVIRPSMVVVGKGGGEAKELEQGEETRDEHTEST
jgi:molecular chaperone GrpE